MKSTVFDREYDKFREADDGKSKVAVTLEGDTGLLEGVSYDDIQATFPSSLITVYSYYLNTTLQAQIEVTFTNASKNEVQRARRL